MRIALLSALSLLLVGSTAVASARDAQQTRYAVFRVRSGNHTNAPPQRVATAVAAFVEADPPASPQPAHCADGGPCADAPPLPGFYACNNSRVRVMPLKASRPANDGSIDLGTLVSGQGGALPVVARCILSWVRIIDPSLRPGHVVCDLVPDAVHDLPFDDAHPPTHNGDARGHGGRRRQDQAGSSYAETHRRR
jgi:hypothetical protein